MISDDIQHRVMRLESFLLAADGQFLGKLSTNQYDYESILNPYGRYGSKFSSFSIWNQYGRYGSQYSTYSPYNQYSVNSPLIYLRGRQYGYLTNNPYRYGNKVKPDYLEQWMNENRL